MGRRALSRLVPDAGAALSEILDAGRGVVDPPIRAEIFGPERFAEHGRALAAVHRADTKAPRPKAFYPRLRDNIAALAEAYQYIAAQADSGYYISPAAEWLLDNYYLIEGQLKEIRDGLPRRYFRDLPTLIDPPLAGLPRIYGVAWSFVAHTDSGFDEELLERFLGAYQQTRDLTLGELWALPTTLRVVLIENLRRLAERVAVNKAARELAYVVDDSIERYSIATLDRLLDELAARGARDAFLAQLALSLQDNRGAAFALYHEWLQRALPDVAAARVQQPAEQTADNLSVSNAIGALRAMGTADWPGLVARTNRTMQLLLTVPTFAAERDDTRDQTVHEIEKMSRRSGRSERTIARTVLELMRRTSGERGQRPSAGLAVSYWLDGPGRRELARRIGFNDTAATLRRSLRRRAALPAYLGVLAAGTFALVALMLRHHSAAWAPGEAATLLGIATAVLIAFPASEAVVAIINRLICESVRPRGLPRLALIDGIPAEHRVIVVIPAIIATIEDAAMLAHRLELHYLANPERHAQFALLTDFADADTETRPNDEDVLAAARARIDALNARYPAEGEALPRFLLLHRLRTFSPTERRWIGWERKRGKLEQLVTALAQPDPAASTASAFIDFGSSSRLAAGTRYVVTLDADSELPPGRLRELVGVASHPDNAPQIDPRTHTVVRGYGILQPRVVTPLPAAEQVTPYHWLFAGQPGIDPYSVATSEVYQDLFAEGSFIGKGLLDVKAVHAALSNRLPEGQVLSHDLLEGSRARCAAVTDVTIIEDAPFHADVAASRLHRWTRGDWQLLPLLFGRATRGVRAINRWKMIDNLRRSLVAPMSLLLLVLALATDAVTPLAACALIFAAYASGPLLGAIAGFAPTRDDVAKGYFYRRAFEDLGRAFCCGLWALTQLLQSALLHANAVVRALYRTAISRRHLLQWRTAAAAERAAASRDLPGVIRRHWTEPVVAVALLIALIAIRAPELIVASVLCTLWAAAPVWTWAISRVWRARRDDALSPAHATYLQGIARDTWRLFEDCVGADDHHLPPDNLQMEPHVVVAHRTSPTNIGFYLLATFCARSFGWIDIDALLARVEATLTTLGQLTRHRGHFLNWYDTTSLAPLTPLYVSTVDSGNLSACLLAVAQACDELARTEGVRFAGVSGAQPGTAARLAAVAATCRRLAWEPDFHFLYDAKRRLFRIGYRVVEQQLDGSCYDLLASEARLTSLLAIARGDVPVDHWAALGRPFYAAGAHAGLRSWSGSMFEYLLPSLLLAEPQGSVLQNATYAAIREQIAFGRARRMPWGVSESAYAARDQTLAYQYSAHGVPRLALRRTPRDEVVVAPYATALAAPYAPHRAAANFRQLERHGARGRYGFFDALDFTPSRRADRGGPVRVATFMAHHQGMTLIALADLLLAGTPRRWAMGEPRVEAVASLLHERAPREVMALPSPPPGPMHEVDPQRGLGVLHKIVPEGAAVLPTQLLSNGRYSLAIRGNGAGWSRWGRIGITRWRDDALRDAYGSFFYLRRERDAPPVSLTFHPAPDPAARYECVHHEDRACFASRWSDLDAQVTVWVSAEDDIEFRRVELSNRSDRVLEVELISAFEATLTEHSADEAHPAFSNLFVSARWLAAHGALLFDRTPRLPTEQAAHVAHFLAYSEPPVAAIRIETDRARWLGRNGEPRAPLAAFGEPAALGDANSDGMTLDTGLDPLCAMSARVRIAPQSTARLVFCTAASDDRATLVALIDKYRQSGPVERASMMSATLTAIRVRDLQIGAENLAAIQTLTTALVSCLTRAGRPSRSPEGKDDEADTTGASDRRDLWRLGISGDRPIVLVSASNEQGVGLLRTLAQALRVWSWGGVDCDLVMVNAEPRSYSMPLQREIAALSERYIAEIGASPAVPPVAGFHAIHADELSADESRALRALARIEIEADGRPLHHHVQDWLEPHDEALAARRAVARSNLPTVAALRKSPAVSRGSFSEGGREFAFNVSAAERPRRPWVNVIANPAFGAQISEAGGGYTWAQNSRMNQLTPWSNDPVADAAGEWWLLQDTRTHEIWSITPSASGDAKAGYRVAHGQGYTVISHRHGDLDVEATWCVDPQASVKEVRVRLTNRGARTLLLRAVAMAEWQLGGSRHDRATVTTSRFQHPLRASGPTREGRDAAGAAFVAALLATQRERSAGFGEGTAFLATTGASADLADWTCDRRECFDTRGFPVVPSRYGRREGDGLDPCAAMALPVRVDPGASAEYAFLLGFGADAEAAQALAVAAASAATGQRLERARAQWASLLGAMTVQTPDPLFDAMVNRWLLYQTVSCRLWAKAGFYQAGGAFGFRDQLQDAMALAWAAPEQLRQQILLSASRQFEEGDVQHWWHPPTGAGVRTRSSDDLLWLPYACVHYILCTGDTGLLDEMVPFVAGAAIPDGHEDAYYVPTVTPNSATVFEHCARAIDRSLVVGAHGLPLIGIGDWNDGMNRVGHQGHGESVWLAWFLCRLVADFAPLARGRGEEARAARWESAARDWRKALQGEAWDGEWYKRAFFDDGTPLGSHVNRECRIDLIAQAWAVMSNAAPAINQRTAMAAADAQLVDRASGLIKLLTPPLQHAQPSAGYIQAYPPGVRENGGQYSHAGVWALFAQAQLGDGDTAYRYFTYLSPAHRARDPEAARVYAIEPYVLAGDVYSEPPYVGRGGWSWYTGSAAWLHRAAIEAMFGMRQRADAISFEPRLPSHWDRAALRLQRDGRTLTVIFARAGSEAAQATTAGTTALRPGEALHWAKLGTETTVAVTLPARAAAAARAPSAASAR